MPADEYAVAGGGALKLKGGKVQKHKKKKKDRSAAPTSSNSHLERSLSAAIEEGGGSSSPKKPRDVEKAKKRRGDDEDDYDNADAPEKPAGASASAGDETAGYKTEAERRHEEIQRRKLLKMFEDGTARPELLKTHKERVEGLNTYLSKLSEHHDMPKIGPG